MIRTQIRLTEQQARLLRAVAGQEGISVAEVIRRCVDESLARRSPSRAELYRRAAGLVGQFADPEGGEDLSADHDQYLEEALG